ncbi:dioxygenase [Clavibacter michiganensis]|nr:dioxygenase [Clavibacter michiganensis]
MTFRGFATINFWADDVSAAAAWYTQLLQLEPYFTQVGPDGQPVYIEFRIGADQDELGIVDRRYSPPGPELGPGGAIMYWHADDLDATLAQLRTMGATDHQPVTPRGNSGFITASVLDPFGNIIGVMQNPHYLQMHAR